jgi:hypothetical protein
MKQIRLKQITNKCGDIGLMEYACHPSLDKRIFREWNGGMEWTYEKQFAANGWNNRTYGSVFKPSDFVITT